MVCVVLGEIFLHKFYEQFTNTFFHVLAIWWVELYNLPVFITSGALSIAIIEKH